MTSALVRACLLLTLFSLASSAYATRYHVNANATGSATGLSWTNAFTDLQVALSMVIPGDEMWVAAGQYRPTTGTSRTSSFQLRNGVDLYGGFVGTETLLEERDLEANITVLNGDIGEPGTTSDNSYRVVTANNINTHIVLDGFRIMNGYSAAGNGYNGGGLNVQNALGGNVHVRNCLFVNNYSGSYGGGIYLAAAVVTLEDCTFNNNSAGTGGDGGAIYNGNNNGGYSILGIRGCRFINNTARRGACIFGGLDFDSLLIDRCMFTNNTSELSILEFDGFNAARLSNTYIIGNTVNGSTSNVFRVQTTAPDEAMTINNCTIAQNFNLASSVQQEIIRVYGTQHRIENSILAGNTAYNGRQVSTGMVITNSIVPGGHPNGTGILDMDPLFAQPSFASGTNFDATSFDYTLLPASPGINAGANDLVPVDQLLDLAGNVRIQGGTVDMGCYESDLSTGVPPSPAPAATWYFDVQQQALRYTGTQDMSGRVLRIIDANGGQVATIPVALNTVQVSLSPGMYLAITGKTDAFRFVVP